MYLPIIKIGRNKDTEFCIPTVNGGVAFFEKPENIPHLDVAYWFKVKVSKEEFIVALQDTMKVFTHRSEVRYNSNGKKKTYKRKHFLSVRIEGQKEDVKMFVLDKYKFQKSFGVVLK